MESTEKIMENMFNKLDNFLKTETVIGNPFTVGAVTLVPIVTVSFGLGGGLGGGKDNKGNDGNGGGGGVGARIAPNAILVIKNDEVSVLPLRNQGSLEKILEMVPELVTRLDCCKSGDKAE